MQHDTFIGHVQDRARLTSRGDAERATRATLETLAERLTADEAKHIAAQLPQEIGLHLERTAGEPTRFGFDEFIDRVEAREKKETPGVDRPDVVQHARAVCSVLQEAASAGEFRQVVEQMPDDLKSLFQAGSEGRFSEAG